MAWLRLLFLIAFAKPLARFLTGVDVLWRERLPKTGPAIVVANHNSHVDTLLLLALFSPGALRHVRPAAAADYFLVNPVMAWISRNLIGIVPVERGGAGAGVDVLAPAREALAAGAPRRSILACAFSGEEDGLLGSQAFVRDPPVALDAMVAMLNLDMVGRGETDEVVVLGTEQSADLAAVLKRAERHPEATRIQALTGKAEHLWQRSDHYNFFQAGVPVLFFFESESELDNPDYHTFRDTLDLLNLDKIARTARLTFNAAWILSEDDERPSRPGG